MGDLSPFRQAILDEAVSWIGTPYRHQGGTKGVGCDCLGLVRGIWASVYANPAPKPGPYSGDWAEAGRGDQLLAAARALCGNPISAAAACPADILVFRWRAGLPSRHLGILAGDGRFIHAYSGHGVLSSALVPQWRNRISGVFVFPQI